MGLKIVLVSPYEIGRQPFALAQPAAWLGEAGFEVECLDLAVDRLHAEPFAGAGLVIVHAGMLTATRIAIEALPRIRRWAPQAHVCVFGLYAPLNADMLRDCGAQTILGGEVEPELVALARRLRDDRHAVGTAEPVISLGKIAFRTPDRSGLPPLERYARLQMPDGARRTVGFAEASRGCKHLCRHCPVVPVYDGVFRVIPVDVVMQDVRQQVQAGAQHVSFGDPDFLNGPTHGLRVVRALHDEFPSVTYDATIKVEHIVAQAALLPELGATGCLFVTTAVESIDDQVLGCLDKGHSGSDFERAARLLDDAGIAIAPTFVAFTPWTSLDGYIELLERIVALGLVENVAPIQLAIRLLVPKGSRLLSLPGFRRALDGYDAAILGYRWSHRDRRVDALQSAVQAFVSQAEQLGLSRSDAFREIWRLAFREAGRPAPALPQGSLGGQVPRLSEPWYCCAEPTSAQLAAMG